MRHNDPVNANNMHGGGYVIGVDFGTLSGRALVVRAADGAELGTAVHEYRHGVMDAVLASSGRPLPPDWALQDPEDYRDVLRHAVPAAVADAGIDPAQVIGIGTDDGQRSRIGRSFYAARAERSSPARAQLLVAAGSSTGRGGTAARMGAGGRDEGAGMSGICAASCP